MARYIGLMSGTSLDGLDVVLADDSEGRWTVLAFDTFAFPNALYDALVDLSRNPHTAIEVAAKLDLNFAQFCAHMVNQFIEHHAIEKQTIRAIGSHGQTVLHHPHSDPQQHFTVQIGCPSTLAEMTGLTVVADFRRRDMAAGGQGAPLLPAFHKTLFNGIDWGCLNIGGIANLSHYQNGQLIGFDTGPGNTIIDALCRQYFNLKYDLNGKIALSAKAHPDIIDRALADPYFSLVAPKSTGPEYFNLSRFNQWVGDVDISPQALVATATEITCISIANTVNHTQIRTLWLCGGGAMNSWMSQRIQQLTPNTIVRSTTEMGIDVNALEALGFAWLARERLDHRAIDYTQITGAKTARCLGGIY